MSVVDRFCGPLEGSLWLSPWYPAGHRQSRYLSPWNELSILDETLKDFDRSFFGQPGGECVDRCRGSSVIGHHVQSTEGDDKTPGKYSLNVPLGKNIEPGDLTVTLKDQVMTIEVKKEQKSADGNSRVYREVTRSFTLPQNVDMDEIKSILTPEGFLKIEAPLTQPPQIEMKEEQEPPKPIEIPINKS